MTQNLLVVTTLTMLLIGAVVLADFGFTVAAVVLFQVIVVGALLNLLASVTVVCLYADRVSGGET